MTTAAVARRSESASLEEILRGVEEGRARLLARALSWVEGGGERARRIVESLYPRTGKARVVGITGPPGAGKSTLVDRLARALRARDLKVGILAVDPTSPFTGGALLGDRIRMQSLYTDPHVFIRSMATRGAMGGLSRASRDAVDVLDAAGFDWILLETVGVGQDEVDVVRTVDTVVVVTLPGLGDDIQAIKAGLMEIADLFVINKSDREGADRTRRDLELVVGSGEHGENDWLPPILKTVASLGKGVEELLEGLEDHFRWLKESGRLEERRLDQHRLRVEKILTARVLEEADALVGLDQAVREAFEERRDPYRTAEGIFSRVVEAPGSGRGPRGRAE